MLGANNGFFNCPKVDSNNSSLLQNDIAYMTNTKRLRIIK